MIDYSKLPDACVGHDAPYFPPLYQKPDCRRCEKRKECGSYGKYQRDRRDFTYTSGRCPRLPDRRGFVEQDERELYAQTFPLVHAERGQESLWLSLSIPGQKRLKRVYRSNGYGVWWFRDGKDPDTGYVIRRILSFSAHSFASEEEILEHMEGRNADYCVLPVNITDGYL